MSNVGRFNGFNLSSNSHTNLNTRLPTPPISSAISLPRSQQVGNPRTVFKNGVYVNGINRVPPPPALSNNR
jgi:hypothetical protein